MPAPASEFAVRVLTEFVALGVRDIVVSPGSRSQALALAAAGLERRGLVRVHVRIDERGAGFLALGVAAESGVPALVITTSGGAVANLHPAVLEAHHSAVPLVLLTADRPEELRGIGSNQTTDQLGMFGDSVRLVRDVQAPHDSGFNEGTVVEFVRAAFAAATGRSGVAGPVQLNIAFREPLSGAAELPDAIDAIEPAPRRVVPTSIRADARTVVIAGHGAGPDAEETARALGAPLLAEVSSGARFGPNLVCAYRELLADPDFGGLVTRAIVYGHPTLSREVPALLERDGVEVIVVRSGGKDYNPGHRVSRFVDALTVEGEPDAREGRSWPGRWVAASRALLDTVSDFDPELVRTDDREANAAFTRRQLDVFREPVTRRMLVEAVWRATWPHDRLVFGASRLIRVADGVVSGKKIAVHANRGLAGIDGTIATAMGIAIASQAGGAQGVMRVVLGDLAMLHDAGSLLLGHGEQQPRVQVIVGNDGGGSLFDKLEVAATAHRDDFDRVLYTPHTVDLAALAAAYGWRHVRAGTRGELDEALTASDGGTIVEVPLPRE